MDNLFKSQLVIGISGYGLAIFLAIITGNDFPISWPILLSFITTLFLLIGLIVTVSKNATRKFIRKQKGLLDDSESTSSSSIVTTIMIVVGWWIIFKL